MGGTAVSGAAANPGAFPFAAVVGHDDVKTALLLNAVDPRIGGVLLRGQKGSAKTTLARALAALLPGTAPFVELPLGATEDRVVGTIDIESALTEGRRRFHPGLLLAADGGVLYVDEVNLLADHLVDVLLDVAVSGVNRVEREGVSESHPARFVLVGSMNPEEGELRPQLLDRFGLSLEVTSSADPRARAEAVRRRMLHDADPAAFAAGWVDEQATLAQRLAQARPATIDDELVLIVSRMCAAVGAEGLRADLVMCRAAAALAGWEGRPATGVEDVRRVAPFALAHRRRRDPFEQPGIDPGELDEALEQALDEAPDTPSPDPAADGDGAPAGSDQPLEEGEGARRIVTLQGASGTDAPSGRRTPGGKRRGRVTGARPPAGPVSEVALGATVRSAAARRGSAMLAEETPLVLPEDLREAVHEEKVANLVVLTVDASASMGVERRMAAVKGAVLSLLLDAYQRRDRVSLVTFRDDDAEVVLRPTGSVEVARARLGELRSGGRTPLAAGVTTAQRVAMSGGTTHRPLVVLVSDGRATASAEGTDPLQEAYLAADRLRLAGVAAVVVDAEDGPTRLGLAHQLAERMAARYLTLPELSAGTLSAAVRQVMA